LQTLRLNLLTEFGHGTDLLYISLFVLVSSLYILLILCQTMLADHTV